MKAKNMKPHLTRQSDVSDINPQRFSRETVIGNHWDMTSLMSRSPERQHKMTPNELQYLRTELDKWQNAVIHSRSTIKYLEERSDVKTRRIRELEAKVKELGGTP